VLLVKIYKHLQAGRHLKVFLESGSGARLKLAPYLLSAASETIYNLLKGLLLATSKNLHFFLFQIVPALIFAIPIKKGV
jgi:hypothetical protein